MKILKIALITLGVLAFIALVAGVIFIKTFDVNRFKPQILAQATKALNRGVDFEKAGLGISLFRGVSLDINNLTIADDPAIRKDNLLSVKNISLSVDLLKYLFKKEVSIPSVFIDSPHLKIVRQKKSPLDAQAITKTAEDTAQGNRGPVSVSASVPARQALPKINISSIKSSNGTITFIDRASEPPLNFEILDFSFSLNNISLNEAFPFVIEASVLSGKKNIKLEGKARIDLKTITVEISQLKGITELSDISLEKIPAAFPALKGAVLPEALKGKVELSINDLIVSVGGLINLAGEASLSNGFMQFKQLNLPIKDAAAHMSITARQIAMDKAGFSLGQGTVSASGKIDDYLSGQTYNLEAEAKNLLIQELAAQNESGVRAEGLIAAKMKLRGQGLNSQALKTTMAGEGEALITQARLRNINVLRTVLDKISMIPVLADKVENGLPERYKRKLEEKDTTLSDIRLPLMLSGGRITVNNAVITADEFIFEAAGEIGFDATYTVEGSFLIPQELSASMSQQVPELQYLFNTDNQIYIPLKVSGRAGQANFIVDSGYIAKHLLINQAEQQLLKALKKATGEKEGAPDAGGQATPDKKSSTEDLIRGVLGDILEHNK